MTSAPRPGRKVNRGEQFQERLDAIEELLSQFEQTTL